MYKKLLLLSLPMSVALATPFSPYADLTINTHWDSQYQDMEPQDLVQISKQSGVNNFHLAFITDAGTCNPAWGGQSSMDVKSGWGSHLLNNMRAQKINYSISLGGASGSDLSAGCSQTELTQAYEKIIQTYHPVGLDFDIENGSANVPKVMESLKAIQKKYPAIKLSFTLPTLPEGLTTDGKNVVTAAKNAELNFSVNIMAMDYGPAYNNDMSDYAIQAVTNLQSFLKSLYPAKSDVALWQMVQVTPMIGVNDVNVESFTLANADTLRQFAEQKQLGLLSMWSVARDKPCADKWASPICSGNNLQSSDYEFAKHFMNSKR